MLRATVAVFAAVVLTGCAGAVRQRIYLPDPLPAATPAWRGPAPEAVRVTTGDGLTLRGFYWPPADPAAPVMVFFHGNGGNLLTAGQMAEPLARDGAGLLVADYRGYSGNPGAPTEAGLMADGEAFLRFARERAPAAPLYLFGYSLGSAVALEMAARHEVAGVVTLGAFTSLAAAAPPATRALLPDRFDNLAAIARVDEPILQLHGTADEIVPFAQAARLRAAARPGLVRFLRLDGAPHRPDLAPLAATIWENLRQMPRPAR